MKVKTKASQKLLRPRARVRPFFQLVFAVLFFMAICDVCQPSHGFGASAASIKTTGTECTQDIHCQSNEYCFQHTGKCSVCAGEQLCTRYGRSGKSTFGPSCVKSVLDCGPCLPNYTAEPGMVYCKQVGTPDSDSFDKFNKSGHSDSGKTDLNEIISGSSIHWIGIGIAAVVVPFIAVCLVFIARNYQKRQDRTIEDHAESLPMVPLPPSKPDSCSGTCITPAPLGGAIGTNLSEIQLNPPEEYQQPPPYRPYAPVEATVPASALNREVLRVSNQQAVPFDYGVFGSRIQELAGILHNSDEEEENLPADVDMGAEHEPENNVNDLNNFEDDVEVPDVSEDEQDSMEQEHEAVPQPTAASTPARDQDNQSPNVSGTSADSGTHGHSATQGHSYIGLDVYGRLQVRVPWPETGTGGGPQVWNPDDTVVNFEAFMTGSYSEASNPFEAQQESPSDERVVPDAESNGYESDASLNSEEF